MRPLICLTLTALISSPAFAGSTWPQFRGPGALGVSDEPSLPDVWSTTDNVAWKADIPGRGWSSPVVWGGRVFLTTCVSDGKEATAKKGLYMGGERKASADVHHWLVLALDAGTGRVLWQREAHHGVPETPVHLKNSYASETPVTDGERVYAYFGNVGVFCFGMDSAPLWSKKLGIYKTMFGWGTAASPVLHDGRLYVVDDNEQHSFLVALDAKTGDEIWRVDRDEKSNWATPFVWQNEKRTELVTAGSRHVRSYSLDGKLLWEFKGMSSLTIPTPFASDGLLYVGSGYVMDKNRPLYAIRPGASGDISLKKGETSNDFIAWCQPTGAPYNPSFLAYDGHIYVLKDRGTLSCSEAKTGKEVYKDQKLGASAFTSSPWAYGGKVFCLSEDGDTFVVQAGAQFKLLGKNSLGELTLATPAIADGALFIRTESKLYRIQKRPAAPVK